MSDRYQAGDFVKIVSEYPGKKAKLTYEGPLVKSLSSDRVSAILNLNYSWFADAIEAGTGFGSGVDVSIERIAGPIPTEPGVYIRLDEDVLGPMAYTLTKDGTWFFGGDAKLQVAMESIHKTSGLRKVA